jgi:chorismate synthase
VPGNSYGQMFRITTAGESHGPSYVVIVDGMPPGIELSEEDLKPDLDRRRPGQSKVTTQRDESDEPSILSGVFEGRTTGTPIAVAIQNRDQRPRDYGEIREKYRPGHADFTFDAKFGFRDYRGGGRSSARETSVRVAAGAIAKKLLRVRYGTSIVGYVKQIGGVSAEIPDPAAVTLSEVEANIVRCPDPAAATRMIDLIEEARRDGDSIGGIAEIVASGVPPGWGEPVFDKLKADLGKAMLSLPAVMGVEYGAGFAVASMKGSEANDPIEMRGGRVATRGNRHGGMLGGISSGMPIVLRCAVKPTSSIPREQETITRSGEPTTIAVRGRHDPCLLPRFVPMAEAMMALTLADHALRHEAGKP